MLSAAVFLGLPPVLLALKFVRGKPGWWKIVVAIPLIFYLQRTSKPRVVTIAPDQKDSRRHFFNIKRRELALCPQLRIIRIDGDLFFGSVNSIEEKLDDLANGEESNLLIVGTGISLIDLAGAELLMKQAEKWRMKGGRIYFCSLKKQVRTFLRRGNYWEELGEDCFFETKEGAIHAIYQTLDKDWCASCEAKIFLECQAETSVIN